MLPRILSGLILVNLGLGSIANAQSSAVAQLYGEGVHRYFSRDYLGAEQLLTRAVEAGSQDPRAFYFRGLARSANGGDGEIDFAEGARLESSGRVGVNIGMALTRIQGFERAKIEKARQDARLLAQQERELQRQRMPVTPPPPTPLAQEPPATTDPFTGDGLRSEQVEVVPDPPTTAEQPDDATVDPFTDEPAPSSTETPTPSDATPQPDPFSESETPAEVQPAESDTDPFGG